MKTIVTWLVELGRERATCLLHLTGEGIAQDVLIHEGMAVYATPRPGRDDVVTVLVQVGRITSLEATSLLSKLPSSPIVWDQNLSLFDGVVLRGDLYEYMESAIRQRLLNILGATWTGIERRPFLEVPGAPLYRTEPARLVIEGVMAHFGDAAIAAECPISLDGRFRVASTRIKEFPDFSFSLPETDLLARLDGHTLEDLIGSGLADPTATKRFVCACALLGFLEADGGADADDGIEEFEMTYDPELSSGGAVVMTPPTPQVSAEVTPVPAKMTKPADATSRKPVPGQASKGVGPDKPAAKLSSPLFRKFPQYADKDFFALLEVGREFQPFEIKTGLANFVRTNQFHRFEQAYTGADVELGLALLELVSMAYTVLTDAKHKGRYMEHLAARRAEPFQVDDAKLKLAIQAMMGETLMKHKSFAHAEVFLTKAANGDPKVPEYQLLLAKNLYLWAVELNQELPSKIKGTLDNVLALDSHNYEAYLYLGYYYKRTGRNDLAMKRFKDAVEANAKGREAASELRLLNMRSQQEKKKSTFFGITLGKKKEKASDKDGE